MRGRPATGFYLADSFLEKHLSLVSELQALPASLAVAFDFLPPPRAAAVWLDVYRV